MVALVYTKNHDPWADSDVISTAIMDNFETIYTEAATYLGSHTHDSDYFTKSEMEAAYWHAGNDGDGSGADADKIYYAGGSMHAAAFAGLGQPEGLVVLWYGSVEATPSGWHLCDGTGGTIDLRDKMVVGAGGSYSPGATGGSATFTATGDVTVDGHSVTTDEMPSHNHPFSDTRNQALGSNTGGSGSARGRLNSASTSGNTSSTGSGAAHGHAGSTMAGNAVACMPYYYSLCYIQKTA